MKTWVVTILAGAAYGNANANANAPTAASPLVESCGPSSAIVCVGKYASVLPYPFYRLTGVNGSYEDTFPSTTVPNDTSFGLLSQADFVVFDRERGLELLGSRPSYEFMFAVNDAVHEAPVYVPATNKLYFSQLRGDTSPPGYLPQRVINLNVDPPELGELISDPPIYAPNGGTYHNGLIYWGVSGGNTSIGGIEQRPGIATLDPLTNKTVTLLNNYFGYYFNTVDDLFVDERGDVWFTDPHYSWFNGLTETAPQLETASYRFRPSTGQVSIVDDSLAQPNGIAISPARANSTTRTVYISDTGAASGPIAAALGPQGTTFTSTGKRIIYAFDRTANGNHLINKRPIYLAQDWLPDGLKVAANGYIVTGAGRGVDVLDADGALLVRIQTNYTVQNFAWTGAQLQTLWLMGNHGVSKVEWDFEGAGVALRGVFTRGLGGRTGGAWGASSGAGLAGWDRVEWDGIQWNFNFSAMELQSMSFPRHWHR
ncbi:hypothetical protein EYC84_011269 [Monilinia fructicola]|uniref:SMP-30/Gluconolactonase/LRE-like region domain-containing protein n=1 Tax=Monilinia fructicola TaxID=38448 RepID=A0A5M9JAH8_MONFR|nr:hypothetical protein EYC84_011269 [Monilinia fructicola]